MIQSGGFAGNLQAAFNLMAGMNSILNTKIHGLKALNTKIHGLKARNKLCSSVGKINMHTAIFPSVSQAQDMYFVSRVNDYVKKL